MKTNLLTIIFLCALGHYLTAQDFKKHTFKIGYGYFFQGSGDQTAPALDIAYQYRFNKYLGIEPRVMFGNGKSTAEKNGAYRMSNVSTYDLTLAITPFPEKLDLITLNVGASYRQVYGITGNGYTTNYIDRYGNPIIYPVYKDENAVGFTSVLDIRVLNYERICLGTKATMQAAYTNGDIAWGLSAYLGVKI